jgi:hypothetical protein
MIHVTARCAQLLEDKFKKNVMPRREEVREENFEDRMVHQRKDGEAYNSQKKVSRNDSLLQDFF